MSLPEIGIADTDADGLLSQAEAEEALRFQFCSKWICWRHGTGLSTGVSPDPEDSWSS